MMLQPTTEVFVEPAEWLGNCHPLVELLGSARGLMPLAALSGTLRAGPVNNPGALRHLLRRYHTEILLPVELPAIRRAFQHATRNQLRELLRFDGQLAEEPALGEFAKASQRLGQSQLRKMRPLRDVRLVQRYLAAADRGEAHGWHTLVYGVTMAVFFLPLHPGLLGYARQTTRGFINAAAWSLRLSERDCSGCFEGATASLGAEVAALVTGLSR